MSSKISYVHILATCQLLMLAESGKIKATALAIGTAIASYIDGKTMTTTIDKRRLSKRAGVSMETLRRNLPHLQKVGFLKIEERIGQSHKYTITLHGFDEGDQIRSHHFEQGNPKQSDVPSTHNHDDSLHDSRPYSIQKVKDKKVQDIFPEKRAITF